MSLKSITPSLTRIQIAQTIKPRTDAATVAPTDTRAYTAMIKTFAVGTQVQASGGFVPSVSSEQLLYIAA